MLEVLEDLGAGQSVGQPILEVWNKLDLVGDEDRRFLEAKAARDENVVLTSAVNAEGLTQLSDEVEALLRRAAEPERIALRPTAGKARSWLYEARLVDHEEAVDGRMIIDVRWDPAERGRFLSRFGSDLQDLAAE